MEMTRFYYFKDDFLKAMDSLERLRLDYSVSVDFYNSFSAFEKKVYKITINLDDDNRNRTNEMRNENA